MTGVGTARDLLPARDFGDLMMEVPFRETVRLCST